MRLPSYCFIAIVTIVCIQLSSAYPTFEEYVQDFNKTYSPQEFSTRKLIYDATVAQFASITDYTPGVNNFTDWT